MRKFNAKHVTFMQITWAWWNVS